MTMVIRNNYKYKLLKKTNEKKYKKKKVKNCSKSKWENYLILFHIDF